MTSLWIAIVLIGLATCATRVVPLFWLRPDRGDRPRSSWLDRLGPCLLAAMAVTIIAPYFIRADSSADVFATIIGLGFAGGAMGVRRDVGVATLVGMAAYYVTTL